MSFKDIFKKSFLEGFSGSEIDLITIVAALGIASILAFYIFLVYRVVTRKTFYSKSFNLSLAGITVITAALILTMQSSVVLSLGMVGALSIVRFRTAIKDPMDLMFLFWAIAVGIICGAGLAQISVILSLVVTAGVFILERFPIAKAPMLLVVNCKTNNCEDDIIAAVKEYGAHHKVKSRNVTEGALDLVIELRTEKGKELVNKVSSFDFVSSVSLLSHDGEATF